MSVYYATDTFPNTRDTAVKKQTVHGLMELIPWREGWRINT